MRVLVTSTPGAGHLFPMVPIALALRDAGHEIIWATAPEGLALLEHLGFPGRPAGIDSMTRRLRQIEREPELLELPLRERRPRLAPMFSGIAAPAMLADLLPIADEVRPDLIVHEPLELAAAIVARQRGIPHATVGFGGVFPDRMFGLFVPDLEPLWAAASGGPAPFAGGTYEHLYLHPFPPSLGDFPRGRNIAPVRPLGYDGERGDDPSPGLTGLGRDRPLVYVTFGTEFGGAAPFRTTIDGVAPLDAEVVLTVGHAVDPTSLEPLPPNVRVERYVPQRLVLERAALLVSHAGSGAMLGAAILGLPHLAIPLGADQFDNALALEAAGAGRSLDAEALTADQVAAMATRLLTEPSYRQAAGDLADEIASMPAPSERVADLEALVSR